MLIHISPAEQQLYLYDNSNVCQRVFDISTAKNGLGEQRDSGCTPRGWHYVRAKIGHNNPLNSVFVGRRSTGEIYTDELGNQYPNRDWILTRILWLSGLEIGFNRLGAVDTMRRYIYIHGCPDSCEMGTPLSCGCIRMKNNEIIELFDLIDVGIKVNIE